MSLIKVVSLFVVVSLSNLHVVESSGSPYVRLVDGASANEGRVEVQYDDIFGTICGGITEIEAGVICRELGYIGHDVILSPVGDFPIGASTIWLDSPTCSGAEKSIFQCGDGGVTPTISCDHSSDVGVRCLGSILPPTVGDVRLIEGESPYEGRVEVFNDGIWGTVCDDDFGDPEVQVVCNQLGFNREDPFGIHPRRDFFGPEGSGQIWLTTLNCVGDEDNLLECDSTLPIGDTGSCFHLEDAAVECYDPSLDNSLEETDQNLDDFLTTYYIIVGSVSGTIFCCCCCGAIVIVYFIVQQNNRNRARGGIVIANQPPGLVVQQPGTFVQQPQSGANSGIPTAQVQEAEYNPSDFDSNGVSAPPKNEKEFWDT